MNTSTAQSAETGWGLYPWGGAAQDGHLFHPDDLERAERDTLWGTLFQRIGGTTDGYIVLRHMDGSAYRVRPENFQELPPPAFLVGTPVRTREEPPREGTIRAIGWHFKHRRYMFFLQVGAKASSKSFYDTELTALGVPASFEGRNKTETR